MSAPVFDGRPVRVAIGEIAIAAASPLQARRLADALPAALDRAFARLAARAPPAVPLRQRPADRVAAEIVKTVAERLEAKR
jgi:hypothetical protein